MKLKFAAVGAFALVLAACSQQEEPAPVYITPEYDKYGTPSCPAGYRAGHDRSGSDRL